MTDTNINSKKIAADRYGGCFLTGNDSVSKYMNLSQFKGSPPRLQICTKIKREDGSVVTEYEDVSAGAVFDLSVLFEEYQALRRTYVLSDKE